MKLNANFHERAVVHAADVPWVQSPAPGVERKLLDRIGAEVARATSVVRYAPGSAFARHVHGGGEEFLVLDGIFQDDAGDYPAGTYVRNPPGSAHTPRSDSGCTIFVKLWQFHPDDRQQFHVDTTSAALTGDARRAGVRAALLHEDATETVRLEHWAPGAGVSLAAPDGMEIFVLSGEFEEAGERLRPDSWLRLPPGARTLARAGASGARVWTKSGHLRDPLRHLPAEVRIE